MKYTEEDIVNNFSHFKAYLYGVEKLMDGVCMIGSPTGYSRHCDYVYHILEEMCPNLTRESIETIDKAVDNIESERIHYHFDNKIPYPKDFDYYEDTFSKLKEEINNIRYGRDRET